MALLLGLWLCSVEKKELRSTQWKPGYMSLGGAHLKSENPRKNAAEWGRVRFVFVGTHSRPTSVE